MPLSSEGSPREPARTQMPRATERMWGICSATSTNPLGSASLSMEAVIRLIVHKIIAQSEPKNYCGSPDVVKNCGRKPERHAGGALRVADFVHAMIHSAGNVRCLANFMPMLE